MPVEPVAVQDSILQSIKKLLGIDSSYTAFDLDVSTHINTAMASLADLGVGPEEPFLVEDETQLWEDYLDGDTRSSRIRTYIYLFVRRAFDPPGTGFLSTSLDNQIRELEWRISSQREESVPIPEEVLVSDE